ncbi:MAG: hypothetical protein E7420_00800 [Ruminococcaceae bacterium]|nr:hypothetical protein [Oscillospiraceae bacterium]
MNKKRIFVITLCAVLALALGFSVFAATSYGSEDDPLITKSYLTQVLLPQLQEDFKEELDAAVADIEKDGSGEFSVITLSKGQTVKCGVGCEIMLRIGSAEAYEESSPAMVNTTTAESIFKGYKLEVNNLYLVTIEGNGFKATSDNTKVLIKGDYTIA